MPSSLSSGSIGVANGETLGRAAMKLEVFAEGSPCLSCEEESRTYNISIVHSKKPQSLLKILATRCVLLCTV
jgi:hypothetical protein